MYVSGINLDEVEEVSSDNDIENNQIPSGINRSIRSIEYLAEEDDRVRQLANEEFKVLNVLELKGDYYSLAFFGLYLDTDDEDLSSHKCVHEV